MPQTTDSRRIAKNTVVLYFRMLFQMAVYFYTSRVVLNTLGVVDYGIYDLVGGVVGILVFLNNSMAVASQRFITYALGRNNQNYLNRVFSACVIAHFCLSVLILLIGETAGLWCVMRWLVIPAERFHEALWVYQCSLLTALVLIVSAPYNAMIIAHERMTAFAAITILDVVAKLLIVISLAYYGGDKLVVYATLLLFEALGIRFVYGMYCRIRFRQTRFQLHGVGRSLFREIGTFAGWSMLGNLALVGNNYGLNIILNLVGGPVVNAARAVAFQLQTAIMAFIASFQTAVNPQITKNYAQSNLQEMNVLILRSSKFSFFLMLFIAIPLLLETDTVLGFWLHQVPQYAPGFTRLLLCVCMMDCVANSMMVGAAATGNIRRYHIVIGLTLLSALPLAYWAVNRTEVYASVFAVQLFIVLLAQLFRMFLCRQLFGFSIRAFALRVVRPMIVVSLFSIFLPVLCHRALDVGWVRLMVVVLISTLSTGIAVFGCGLEPEERTFFIKRIIRK